MKKRFAALHRCLDRHKWGAPQEFAGLRDSIWAAAVLSFMASSGATADFTEDGAM